MNFTEQDNGEVLDVNYHAVRAFIRLWEPEAAVHDMVTEADAKFDGGEWSRGAHYAIEEQAQHKIAARVAPRFGITADQLVDMLDTYTWEQNCMWQDANGYDDIV